MDNDIKARRLLETIERSGMKQKDFAQATSINPNTLSRFLHGAEISTNYLARVSAAFGVSLPYLLGDSDIRTENNQASNSMISANREAFNQKNIELYMHNMGVRIEKTIIIGDKHFRGGKRGWLELGTHDEFDDLEMQKQILDSTGNKLQYIISVEFGDEIKTMTYDEYTAWLQGLIQLNRIYICNGLFNQGIKDIQGDIQDDILSAAIRSKK